MIKYLGSKRLLLPRLVPLILATGARQVMDVFSGTARVGHALKEAGLSCLSNDHNLYAATLARCYIQADLEEVGPEAERWIQELNELPGQPGYFTRTFCEQSHFFQPHNGARIDAIREVIAEAELSPELEAVLLVSLMEAADRVDSTVGLQMAYLKSWAPRSYKSLQMRLPRLLPRAKAGKGRAFQLEAQRFAESHEADLAYLDPPYNQHRYLANYHIWETLIRWDAPEVYGKACKRVDVKEYRSPFNRKREALGALKELIGALRAQTLVVSFSDDGWISAERMEELLRDRGEVRTLELDFPRHVGARIGIHNREGERVGKVGRLRNRERVFLCDPQRSRLERALGAWEASFSPGAS